MIFALRCLWNFVSGCLNDKQQRQKKILSRALPKAMRTQSPNYGKCTYPKNGNVKTFQAA
ncbi:MAG: hypothetical protein IJV35_08410 [Neisseriaceae bacterium]|nr:hypothetical protein [Neisseriaceae bacterium]